MKRWCDTCGEFHGDSKGLLALAVLLTLVVITVGVFVL